MSSYRIEFLRSVITALSAGAYSVISAGNKPSPVSDDQQTLWNLEHKYWRCVEENDLQSYRSLWHRDFLGWPSLSSAPVRKDHVTHWITAQTCKGLTPKLLEFKPAEAQIAGNVAVLYYWITFKWLDKDGMGEPHTLRITHTWLRDAKDWRIIGGMSMPEAAPQ
jgi:ketosteroid isomerase-like protein